MAARSPDAVDVAAPTREAQAQAAALLASGGADGADDGAPAEATHPVTAPPPDAPSPAHAPQAGALAGAGGAGVAPDAADTLPCRVEGSEGGGPSATDADDLRPLRERLERLRAQTGVVLGVKQPGLLRFPLAVSTAVLDAVLAPGGAAQAWKGHSQTLKGLLMACDAEARRQRFGSTGDAPQVGASRAHGAGRAPVAADTEDEALPCRVEDYGGAGPSHNADDVRPLRDRLDQLRLRTGAVIRVTQPALQPFPLPVATAALDAVLAPGGAAESWHGFAQTLKGLVAACEAEVRRRRFETPLIEPQAAAAEPPAARKARSPPRWAPSPPRYAPSPPHYPPPPPFNAVNSQQRLDLKVQLTPMSLHVRQVPVDAQPAEVAAFFGRFGGVHMVIMPPMKPPRSHVPWQWRFASVTMVDEAAMLAALHGAQRQQMRPGTLPLRVDRLSGALLAVGQPGEWVAPEPAAAPGRERGRQNNGRRSRTRSRSRERVNTRSPPPRARQRSPQRARHRSHTRSRSRGADAAQMRARRAATPPLHAPYAPMQPPLPPPPALHNPAPPPAMAALPAVQYRSMLSCAFFARRGSAVAAPPFSVVGTPLSGDPALPRPLALGMQMPVSAVEALGAGANLGPERRCVVALDGADADSAAALKELADMLAAPAAQPGGEAQAAGVILPDGGAHFFVPPSEGALRLVLAALPPGSQPPPLTAAGVAVSLLLTNEAVSNAAATRATIVAALQAAARMSAP
jgi:hypothetical protein